MLVGALTVPPCRKRCLIGAMVRPAQFSAFPRLNVQLRSDDRQLVDPSLFGRTEKWPPGTVNEHRIDQ